MSRVKVLFRVKGRVRFKVAVRIWAKATKRLELGYV